MIKASLTSLVDICSDYVSLCENQRSLGVPIFWLDVRSHFAFAHLIVTTWKSRFLPHLLFLLTLYLSLSILSLSTVPLRIIAKLYNPLWCVTRRRRHSRAASTRNSRVSRKKKKYVKKKDMEQNVVYNCDNVPLVTTTILFFSTSLARILPLSFCLPFSLSFSLSLSLTIIILWDQSTYTIIANMLQFVTAIAYVDQNFSLFSFADRKIYSAKMTRTKR